MRSKTFISWILILILVLTGLVNTNLYSQGTDSRRTFTKKDKLYFGISIGSLQGNIDNTGLADSVYKKGLSVNFGFEAGYFFSKLAGITLGAEFSPYSSSLSLASYSINYDAVDSENESYQMQIKGSGIVEEQTITCISIPACVNFRFGGVKRRFFMKVGFSFDIPFRKTYESSGIFTYDGYYAAYPVTLKNLPSYGFPSNLDMRASGDLMIKSMIPAVISSAGVIFNLTELLQFVFDIHFSRSLGNISGYKPDPDYRLTSNADQMNSIMAGSSDAFIEGLRVNLGLRFYIK